MSKRLKSYNENTSQWENVLAGGISDSTDKKVYTYDQIKRMEDDIESLKEEFKNLKNQLTPNPTPPEKGIPEQPQPGEVDQ